MSARRVILNLVPPFTREIAEQKVRTAEDGWNSRDPQKVAFAYTTASSRMPLSINPVLCAQPSDIKPPRLSLFLPHPTSHLGESETRVGFAPRSILGLTALRASLQKTTTPA